MFATPYREKNWHEIREEEIKMQKEEVIKGRRRK